MNSNIFANQYQEYKSTYLFFNNFLSSNLALKIGGKLENPVQTGFFVLQKTECVLETRRVFSTKMMK